MKHLFIALELADASLQSISKVQCWRKDEGNLCVYIRNRSLSLTEKDMLNVLNCYLCQVFLISYLWKLVGFSVFTVSIYLIKEFSTNHLILSLIALMWQFSGDRYIVNGEWILYQHDTDIVLAW